MAKYLLALLVIFALAFGIYISVLGKIPVLNQLSPTPTQKQETSSSTPNLTADSSTQVLEDDLTALEKDLIDLDSSDNSFGQEVNSL